MHRLYYWMWKSIGDKKFCRHCCLFCKFYEVCRQDGDRSQKDKGREWGALCLYPFVAIFSKQCYSWDSKFFRFDRLERGDSNGSENQPSIFSLTSKLRRFYYEEVYSFIAFPGVSSCDLCSCLCRWTATSPTWWVFPQYGRSYQSVWQNLVQTGACCFAGQG